MFTDTQVFESANTKALWMVIKRNYLLLNLMLKWQIVFKEMTNLFQFTINFRKSHRQPQCTLQLACEGRMLLVWVDLHVSLWAAASKMRVSNSSHISTFLLQYLILIRPHQKKNGGERHEHCLRDSNSSISVTIQNWTHVHINFFA
jgi:hypothetical protein